MAAIEVRGLRRRYGPLEAVKGIDLTVEHGEVVAVLGPNGAGKTTTIHVLEGLTPRSGGDVRVLGDDPETAGPAFRERIGVMLQECVAEPFLRVGELVDLHRSFYRRPRPADAVLRLVGLEGSERAMVRTLSGGRQRRLDLALALVGDPELVFLDEPTTGFDPEARRRAWDVIATLRDGGTTILLSTHYLEEAEVLADRVLVLADGLVVAEGAPRTLAARASRAARISFDAPPGIDASSAPVEIEVDGTTWHVRCAEVTAALHELTGWALAAGVPLDGLSVTRATLDDVYREVVA